MKNPKLETMTDQQFAFIVVMMNMIKKDAYRSLWKLFPLTIAAGILITTVGVEIAIAYGVFSALLQSIEDPVVQHSAWLLALTGPIAMFAYHSLSKSNPDLWSVRFIRNLSTVFAPLYALAGGLFLGILLFPGAVATATSGSLDSLFGLPIEQIESGNLGQAFVTWLQNNLVLAAPLFIGGIVGVSVMALFVGGESINAISTNAYLIFRALSNFKAANKAWVDLRADDARYRKLASELVNLEKLNDSYHRNHAAILASSSVDQFVQRAEAAIEANPTLLVINNEPDSAVSQLFGKQPDLSIIQARIEILKTHTLKHIRSVIDRNLK